MENNEEIKGWSWLGFLFMPYYYAGYGDLTKGLTVAVAIGLFGGISDKFMQADTMMVFLLVSVVLGLSVSIYGGTQATKELPIKKQAFSWLNVFYAIIAYVVGMFLIPMFSLLSISSTPDCNDEQTKALVKQLSLEEFTKQGMDNLNLELTNIRVSSYAKEIDKYECAAEMTVFYEVDTKLSTLPIVYTSQMTEDGENFYVEVFGLK
jgi:hypothetical protein